LFQLQQIRIESYRLRDEKNQMINALESEKYQPLVTAANCVKNDIHKEVAALYKNDIELLNSKERELEQAIQAIHLQQAQTLWYPHGTKVWKWAHPRYGWSTSKPERSKETGTVQIYDGTQDLPSNTVSYRVPKKGDILVFENKKDGTMGKRFDVIAEYGVIKNYHPIWLAEGETPENNIETIKPVKA